MRPVGEDELKFGQRERDETRGPRRDEKENAQLDEPLSLRTMLDGTGTQVKAKVEREKGIKAIASRRRKSFFLFEPDDRFVEREV